MPGITGIIGQGPNDERCATLDRMLDVLRREPFYSCGSSRQDRAGLAAGWAVHAGSFSDANPVWNAARTVCLILNGEEFADAETIAELRRDRPPTPAAQADYIVRWYEELGDAFLERLNGSFSGLLVDLRRDKVLLFNDRYGLARVYVHEAAGAVHFASEAKSLLRVLPQTRSIDALGLAEYSACGCVLQNRSLFSGIGLLPPASCWTFVRGALESKRTYFDVRSWEQLPRLGAGEFHARLDETFTRILPKYFRGSVPIGMSLTGGLDGRMIMAASGHAPGTLACYTFGGTYRDCTDVSIARAVARVCGQAHQVIPIGPEFLAEFGELAERAVYVSDGAMDVTGSVELHANQRARAIAPIRMTGNYGSEILRSNVAFKAQALSSRLFSEDTVELGKRAARTYHEEATGRQLSLITAKQVPWHHHSRLAVEQSQLTMRSPYLDNELVALSYRAPAGAESSKAPALRFIDEHNPSLGRIATDRGLVHRRIPVLTTLLNLYQEFTFRAEYAYDYGMPQRLARIDHAARSLKLERLFLGRHKFYHFRVWYRDTLGPYLRDVLLDPKASTRPHVRPGSLDRLVAEHLAGTHNHTTEIHQALSIELMYRQLIERDWA